MNKEYLKPEAEYVSFIAKEAITDTGDVLEGETGLESSDFNP